VTTTWTGTTTSGSRCVLPRIQLIAVVYKRQLVTDTAGVQYRVLSRLEWIGYNLYGGADFRMRTAPGAYYSAPANTVAHKMRAYSWDSATSTWSVCRETPWMSHNGPAIGLVTTSPWGNTPCGTRWYYLVGFVERQINGTWTVVTPQGVSTFGGTTLAGTTPEGSASASNGMIWDPKPGDRTKPPKRPKSEKKLEQQDLPKAGPPVATTNDTAF
jgi:hypothetical protein